MLFLIKRFLPTALAVHSILPFCAAQETKNCNVRFGLPATVNTDRAIAVIMPNE